jgi:hypothetical protein
VIFAQREHSLTIHSRESNAIVDLIKYFVKEAEQKYLLVLLSESTARTAEYSIVWSGRI